MTMSLTEFQVKFYEVKNLGWVQSLRRGPTGVGHTLEQLIGLEENNIAAPDLGTVELKGHRLNSSSMITLFTFNKKAWKMPPLEAVRKYGTVDASGRTGLYYTMSPNPNGAGLYLNIGEEIVSVRHIHGTVVAEWDLHEVANKFLQKMPDLLLASAFSEDRGGHEWFLYDRARLLEGTSADILKNQIREGNVLLDLRLHDQGTRARNHGTGFRAREKNLTLLFKKVRDI